MKNEPKSIVFHALSPRLVQTPARSFEVIKFELKSVTQDWSEVHESLSRFLKQMLAPYHSTLDNFVK